MKRSEFASRIFILGAVLAVIALPLFFWWRTPIVHAHMAEDGGWTPDVIQAEVGKPLHLRLTSDDVVHGFAIGKMDIERVDILPGKVTDITIFFDRPGIYTFYCTRWCGLNHWRMRGTLEVSGSSLDPEVASVPLYVALGLDIDAPHEAPAIPSQIPSAARGEQVAQAIPIEQFASREYYTSHSPYELYVDLNSSNLTNSERWDLVSYIWKSNTTPEALSNGQGLFAQNCAACHGENGAGNGVFADGLANAGEASIQNMGGTNNMTMQTPVDFTDSRRMMGASPALLQGKILRGGMGTGMPMWGSIFTEEQIWDLVAYLYSFQFDPDK